MPIVERGFLTSCANPPASVAISAYWASSRCRSTSRYESIATTELLPARLLSRAGRGATSSVRPALLAARRVCPKMLVLRPHAVSASPVSHHELGSLQLFGQLINVPDL